MYYINIFIFSLFIVINANSNINETYTNKNNLNNQSNIVNDNSSDNINNNNTIKNDIKNNTEDKIYEPIFMGRRHNHNNSIIFKEYLKNFSKINCSRLDDDNYIDFTQSNAFTLIYFHSPYFSESISFLPKFLSISEYINKLPYISDNHRKLGCIDLGNDEKNGNNQMRFNLKKYPFIIVFSALFQKYIQYEEDFKENKIDTFFLKTTSEIILDVKNTSMISLLLDKKHIFSSLLIFNESVPNDEMFALSQRMLYVLFANCSIDKNICINYMKKYMDNNNFNKIDNNNKSQIFNSDIVLVAENVGDSDFKEKNNNDYVYIPFNYTSFEDTVKIIAMNIVPIVHKFTDFNAQLMFNVRISTILYIKAEYEKLNDNEISDILIDGINNNELNIKWATVIDPARSQSDYSIVKIFGIDPMEFRDNGMICILLFSSDIESTFPLLYLSPPSLLPITKKSLSLFISQIKQGYINPAPRSELIPTSHPRDNLRMVVGRNFDSEISKNFNKSIVVTYLTVNLTSLSEVEELFTSCAKHFSIFNKTLYFAYIDPLMNDIPNTPKIELGSKPYFRYYYRNKTKNYDDFQGNGLNLIEVEEWIIKNYVKEKNDHKEEEIKDIKIFIENERKKDKDKKQDNNTQTETNTTKESDL